MTECSIQDNSKSKTDDEQIHHLITVQKIILINIENALQLLLMQQLIAKANV